MYDNTEIKILEQIYTKPGIHKRELSKQLKIGMPSIDYAIKKIEKLLKIKKSGNQINYYLDYSNTKSIPAIYSVEYLRLNKLPQKIKLAVKDFLKELKEKPLISLIFGSYVKGDYINNSDIDILLVFQEFDSEKIEKIARRISMRTNIKISPVYLNYKDFKESFHDSSKEFFKRIKKDKILLNGIEWWWQLKNEEA